MESIPTKVSGIWESFTNGGTHFIQDTVFTFSGYEISEFMAFMILLGGSVGFVIWLALVYKRPRKRAYLMESGQRYYRP